MAGILAKKCDMTRIIKDQKLIPVTLLEVPTLTVAQVKTQEKDGYAAVVLSYVEGKNTLKHEVSQGEKFNDVKV